MVTFKSGRHTEREPLSIVLLGPPGSGKSTQGRLLSAKYGIPHIEMGELLRSVAAEPTPLGKKVRSFLDRGLLVPDDITEAIIERLLEAADSQAGFVLDGFPRTVRQAEFLDKLLKQLGRKLTAAVFIDVPEAVALARLSRRRVCSGCSASYQSISLTGQTTCGNCAGKLTIRADDRPNIIRQRLELYARETAPVIARFQAQGILIHVDGAGGVDQVFKQIDREIRKRVH